MKLTPKQVEYVAKLANLKISEGEVAKFSEQLSAILEYVDQLDAVDTKGVEPTFNVAGLKNVTATDEVRESLPQAAALANAAQQREGFFVTKGVFEDE